MIKQEFYMTRNDGVKLIRTYSDTNKMVKQLETNIVYKEAIDIYPVKYTYVECEEAEQTQNTNVTAFLNKLRGNKQ